MWGRGWSEAIFPCEGPEGRCLEGSAQRESGGTSGRETPISERRLPKDVPQEQGAPGGTQGTFGVT